MRKPDPEIEERRRDLLIPNSGPTYMATLQLTVIELVCGYSAWRCTSLKKINRGVVVWWNCAVRDGAFDKVPERPLPGDLFTAYVHYLQRKAAEL